ncbi:hypothetical protein Bbelb_290370 [Branchiostoma belcheri]|nr:hypothetical protein Bbelb_290370 [Branchiostoma belcheri]
MTCDPLGTVHCTQPARRGWKSFCGAKGKPASGRGWNLASARWEMGRVWNEENLYGTVKNGEKWVWSGEKWMWNEDKKVWNGEKWVWSGEKWVWNEEKKVWNGEKWVWNEEKKVWNGEKWVWNEEKKDADLEIYYHEDQHVSLDEGDELEGVEELQDEDETDVEEVEIDSEESHEEDEEDTTRKTGGFLGHMAKKACSKCLKTFSRTQENKVDYSGFNLDDWEPRTKEIHLDCARRAKRAKTKASQ